MNNALVALLGAVVGAIAGLGRSVATGYFESEAANASAKVKLQEMIFQWIGSTGDRKIIMQNVGFWSRIGALDIAVDKNTLAQAACDCLQQCNPGANSAGMC